MASCQDCQLCTQSVFDHYCHLYITSPLHYTTCLRNAVQLCRRQRATTPLLQSHSYISDCFHPTHVLQELCLCQLASWRPEWVLSLEHPWAMQTEVSLMSHTWAVSTSPLPLLLHQTTSLRFRLKVGFVTITQQTEHSPSSTAAHTLRGQCTGSCF